MSDATHEHVHGGPDHVPHITPLSTYLKTYGALIFLTCLTVAVSYVDLGSSVNLGIALLIAFIKATAVAALFMHLASDKKFHTAILLSSVVFLFIFITFTMFDTQYRNRVNAEDGLKVDDMTDPFPADPIAAPTPAAPGAAPASQPVAATPAASSGAKAPSAPSASAASSAAAVPSSSAPEPSASAAKSAPPAGSAKAH